MIYIYVILTIVSIALFLAIHYWWKDAIKHGVVSSDTMRRRSQLRNVQIFLLILFLSSAMFAVEIVTGEEISGMQSVILIGILFGVNRNLFAPFYTVKHVPMLKEYALYLRPFDVDEQSILKKRCGYVQTKYFIPENLERTICGSIDKVIAPVYAIGNPGAVLPTTLNSSCIYVKDNDWKKTVADLSDKAMMILLRVGDSDGCRWELLHCVDRDYLTKTILMADDALDIDMIQNHTSVPIPESIRKIDFHSNSVGIWIDDRGEWQYEILKTVGNCSAMIDTFAKAHPDLPRRKNKIGSVIKTKSKSFWPDAVSLILNPIAYVLYNRWSRKMIAALLSYMFMSVIAVAILTLSLADDVDAAFEVFVTLGLPLFLLSFIPWLIFAPKYTMAINSWGGPEIKAHANKILAIWLTIIFAMMLVL